MYEDDPVKVYLDEIAKIPSMTRERERECVRRIRARDGESDNAMKDLVEVNLALVVTIAEKHPSDHFHILDLIQTGNQALLAAARTFADSDAEDFSAFAAPYIERAIVHAVTTRNC